MWIARWQGEWVLEFRVYTAALQVRLPLMFLVTSIYGRSSASSMRVLRWQASGREVPGEVQGRNMGKHGHDRVDRQATLAS